MNILYFDSPVNGTKANKVGQLEWSPDNEKNISKRDIFDCTISFMDTKTFSKGNVLKENYKKKQENLAYLRKNVLLCQ